MKRKNVVIPEATRSSRSDHHSMEMGSLDRRCYRPKMRRFSSLLRFPIATSWCLTFMPRGMKIGVEVTGARRIYDYA